MDASNTSSIQTQQPATRKVSILLGIGIFFFPLIFAWFTLRAGHTTLSRILSFAWLVLSVIFIFSSPSQNTNIDSSSNENISTAYSSNETDNSSVSSDEQVEETPVVEEVQAIQISARDLFRHYEANEVAADRNFKGKLVDISGSVQAIDSGVGDGANVQFNVDDEYGFESVTASGEEDFDNYAASLSKGQQIALRCVGAGEVMGQPLLESCNPL